MRRCTTRKPLRSSSATSWLCDSLRRCDICVMSSLATSVGLMSSIPMERVFSVPEGGEPCSSEHWACCLLDADYLESSFSGRTQGSYPRHAQANHAHVAINRLDNLVLGDVGFHQGASVSEGGLVVAQLPRLAASGRSRRGLRRLLKRLPGRVLLKASTADCSLLPKLLHRHGILLFVVYQDGTYITAFRKSRKTGETYEIQEKAPYTKSTTII